VDSPTQPHHPPVCPRYNAAPPPKRCPVRVPDTVGGNSKPGHTPKRVNIGQTYTHCPVQGCLGRHPVSVASQGRTLSTAACPGAPATPPRYGQGCPHPARPILGGGPKLGTLSTLLPMPSLDTRLAGVRAPATYQGALMLGASVSPNPCHRLACAGAKLGHLWLTHAPARCAHGWLRTRLPPARPSLSSLIYAGNPPTRLPRVCCVFVCISLAAPGWGIPVGQFSWGIFVWPAHPCPNRCPLSCRCHRSNGLQPRPKIANAERYRVLRFVT
jgi:hypothetical protein